MSNVKELRAYFKQAPWSSPLEIDAFTQELGAVPVVEIGKLLPVLLDRGAIGTAAQHRLRCAAFRGIVERSLDRELFVPFVRALTSADSVVRALLVELIPKVNSPEDHGALCEVLGADDPDVRDAAVQILTQVAGAHALEALLKLVPTDGYAGRGEALDLMVPKARHRALPLIAAVLASGSPQDRARAAKWLGEREIFAKDPDQAVALALRTLDDRHARVAAQAVKSIAQLLPEDAFFKAAGFLAEAEEPTLQQSFIEALAEYRSPRVVATLARLLRTAPTNSRMAAVQTLETVALEDAIPPLVAALGDSQLTIRSRARDAIILLNKQGKVELARTVIWLLRSRDVNMRRMAAELAREVGDARGDLIPKLLQFLRDEDWWVRERVVDALAQMAGSRLTDHIVNYLKDPSDVVRRYAVGAMRRVKDPRALGPLVRAAMDDSDWWVREEAILAAAELGDARAVPYLIQVLKKDPSTRLVGLESLRRLGGKEALPIAVDLLRDEEMAVRLTACRFVAELGGQEHAPHLAALLDDADARVRKLAQESMLRWNIERGADGSTIAGAISPLDRMLIDVEQKKADDLILAAGRAPSIKRMGQVVEFAPSVFDEKTIDAMLLPILTPAQRMTLADLEEVDCSYHVRSHDLRFRVNLFRQLAGLSAVFRSVKNRIPNIDHIGVPSIVKTFGDLRNGLVLVGGPTGSGKSTTLAALLDYINRTYSRHIVTIEDPIEVVHTGDKCLINQRETGTHTRSYERALRSAMREDPDVLLVGEMRDLATITFALAAAETGHLVFGTVHTVSADNSIDRIINAFPPGQRPQMRGMLADTLRAVACQHLLRRTDRPGERVLAVEILVNTDAIANLIRKDKAFQIPSVIATARDQGMLSMDASLLDLVQRGIVHTDEAFMRAVDKKQFDSTASQSTPAVSTAEAAEPFERGIPAGPAPGGN